MLAIYVAAGGSLVILGVFVWARWLDVTPAQRAFRAWRRAHRNAQRRITVMKLPNERAQIVGDGAWVVKP